MYFFDKIIIKIIVMTHQSSLMMCFLIRNLILSMENMVGVRENVVKKDDFRFTFG